MVVTVACENMYAGIRPPVRRWQRGPDAVRVRPIATGARKRVQVWVVMTEVAAVALPPSDFDAGIAAAGVGLRVQIEVGDHRPTRVADTRPHGAALAAATRRGVRRWQRRHADGSGHDGHPEDPL